jgi:uncharacterized protein (TIGR02996 family)
MNQEAPFVDAIRNNPRDVATRLVYADWLEDRADARGQLIRIEEEMRGLPVFSDRFWELKHRRQGLRLSSPKEWVELMGYGTDCPPTFAHTPANWKEWWRLIRVFTERWHHYESLADVGGHVAEVRETESRLGRQLPPSVREWVAYAHDVRTAQDYIDVLRDTYQMIDMEGHNALSLLKLCEGNVQWAIRHVDLQEIDPPVYQYQWDYHGPDPYHTYVPSGPEPGSKSLTSFVLGYSLDYMHSVGGGFATDVGDSSELIEQLRQTFPVHFTHANFEIFEAENILVQLNHWPDREYLKVELFKSLPRESLPEFLWNQTNHGGAFHGMFMPANLLSTGIEPQADNSIGPDIPF